MSKYAAWKSFEGDIVKKFKKMGFDASRNWSSQMTHTDPVDFTASNSKMEFVGQCKYGERPNFKQAIEQARRGCVAKREIPLGVVRFKGQRKTYVVLEWADFEKIIINNI